MVHGRLKEKISGKKFLLVLDDVWNERREEWEAVQTPLSHGAPGSRILVTTRGEKVASNMRSKVHRLKQLEEDECWKVFEKHPLKDDDLELNDEQKEIGRRIVEKCKGLPLALKTIGCLLHSKSSISVWQSILESDIWDLPKEDSEIIPALLLSYHHLPSHLKRCFAYCALFPKDYVFVKKELILLWMAENFLQSPHQIRHPEEVGEQYFNDLLSRSFFQQSSGKSRFVMHDFVNDLARYVCGDFCFRLKFDEGKCIPNTIRHFSFAINDYKCFDCFGSLTDAKRLRSFLPITRIGGFDFGHHYSWQLKISVHELFTMLKFLRVLSFCGCYALREVPESVGDLKHLHSLDLSKTRIQKLPDSICSLYNLLILKLNSCSYLEELPSNLHQLSNLRCLEFKKTKVTKMPMHLGELKNLQVMSTFCVDRNSEFSTAQLGGLNLHGRLSIEDLQNIGNPSDALKANLKNKRLLKLKLKWNLNHIPDDPRKEKEVLENLQPFKHLESLSIWNYGGTQFPSWICNNSLSNLTFLQLDDCKYCLCLPSFGLLPYLKILNITGLDGIVSIGAEFYGSSSFSFPSLEKLVFHNMKEWEEWECKTAAFPRLQHLSIEICPKLKALPEQLLHLKKLYIFSSMKASCLQIINIPMSHCYNLLEKIEIIGSCDSITTFPLDFFPKLMFLQLFGCRNLQMITQEQSHNHLKDLNISDCPQFESFPSEGLSAPWLQRISIWKAENLKLLPKDMHILLPSLIELRINNCPQLVMPPDGGLPSNLKKLDMLSVKLNTSLKGTFSANTCLESLSIGKVDVQCFPDKVFLPPSLTSLRIYSCPDLKKLNFKCLSQQSSLKELILENCANLQCLPEEGLPTSISTLHIWRCPLLKQRCQKPQGEDWGKVAHIEHRFFYER